MPSWLQYTNTAPAHSTGAKELPLPYTKIRYTRGCQSATHVGANPLHAWVPIRYTRGCLGVQRVRRVAVLHHGSLLYGCFVWTTGLQYRQGKVVDLFVARL